MSHGHGTSAPPPVRKDKTVSAANAAAAVRNYFVDPRIDYRTIR
jgi:hypothetical protein